MEDFVTIWDLSDPYFYAQNAPILIKNAIFFVFFTKNTPILPKIAKYGLETNSRPN